MFRRKTPQPAISREQFVKSSVLPNPEVRVERGEDSLVCLWVAMPPSPFIRWFPKLAQTPPGERKVQLDEIGSFVWDLCDGETTVQEMTRALSRRHKMNPKEAEVALTTYLRTLARKGLAGIVVPRVEANDNGKEGGHEN